MALPQQPRTTTTIAILATASGWLPPWDPEIVHTGIGGSEEAIINAAPVLVARGYHVTVFANPPLNSPWSHADSNPRYLHVDAFNSPAACPTTMFDIVLCWRRGD